MLKVKSPRRKKRFLKNRQIIMQAAQELFSLKGFEQTTMSDIAQSAEIAAGTIYLYFENKEELFYALIQEGMRELLVNLKNAVSAEKKPDRKLHLLIQIPFEFFEKNRDFYKIYLRELPSCTSVEVRKNKRNFFEGYAEYVNLLENCIQEKLKAKKIPAHKSREIAFLIKGAVDSLIFKYMLEESPQLLTRQTEFLVKFFSWGLNSLKYQVLK